MKINSPTVKYRAIWISDIHLGTRGCKAGKLLDFLKKNESEFLYLVGDIIDGWRLKRSWYWPQEHNDVVYSPLLVCGFLYISSVISDEHPSHIVIPYLQVS